MTENSKIDQSFGGEEAGQQEKISKEKSDRAHRREKRILTAIDVLNTGSNYILATGFGILVGARHAFGAREIINKWFEADVYISQKTPSLLKIIGGGMILGSVGSIFLADALQRNLRKNYWSKLNRPEKN